ncbi:hypothetical protein QZH41_007228 [Actinostola sp. cb2023]|nr:hypothetical protein QZH41_007228 [Actinostola sp. cb2023]
MLGMRGRDEQLNCKLHDFKDKGNYFEYTERSTKTRTGETDDLKAKRKYNNKIFKGSGDERDPYLALESYLRHRPEGPGVDAFYLQPIDNPKGTIWYKTLALKRDGLGNIMKRMAETAGIQHEGNFTNTSGRKTAIQSLRGHFDPLAISELTGHANPNSIQSYSHNSMNTQRAMFDRLANSSTVYSSSASTVVLPVVQTYRDSRAVEHEEHRVLSNLLSSSTLNNCQININFQSEK